MLCRVRVYMSVCEEENMVELGEEHTTLYDETDPGYSRKDKIDWVHENMSKEQVYWRLYHELWHIYYNVKPNSHLLQFNFTKYLLHVSSPEGTSSGS